MCEKAIEIQKLWKPILGDYCTHPLGEWGDERGFVLNKIHLKNGKVYIYRGTASMFNGTFAYDNYETFNKENCVWLPHQDQLQKMIENNNEPPESLISSLWYFLEGPDHNVSIPTKDIQKSWEEWDDYICTLSSMEQLWLVFIMDKKYDKIWNGVNWINA